MTPITIHVPSDMQLMPLLRELDAATMRIALDHGCVVARKQDYLGRFSYELTRVGHTPLVVDGRGT